VPGGAPFGRVGGGDVTGPLDGAGCDVVDVGGRVVVVGFPVVVVGAVVVVVGGAVLVVVAGRVVVVGGAVVVVVGLCVVVVVGRVVVVVGGTVVVVGGTVVVVVGGTVVVVVGGTVVVVGGSVVVVVGDAVVVVVSSGAGTVVVVSSGGGHSAGGAAGSAAGGQTPSAPAVPAANGRDGPGPVPRAPTSTAPLRRATVMRRCAPEVDTRFHFGAESSTSCPIRAESGRLSACARVGRDVRIRPMRAERGGLTRTPPGRGGSDPAGTDPDQGPGGEQADCDQSRDHGHGGDIDVVA
jgi:hypothetical protein